MDLRYSKTKYGYDLNWLKNGEIYDTITGFLNMYEIKRHINYLKSISNFPNEITLKKYRR